MSAIGQTAKKTCCKCKGPRTDPKKSYCKACRAEYWKGYRHRRKLRSCGLA
jgi:hypothetical protein